MNSSKVDKMLDRGGACLAWLFLFYLSVVLVQQWADDDNGMYANMLMFTTMACITVLVASLLALVSRYLYRDIVRTCRSIWWKR